ncbi:MAG: kelch repeat-containing protein, partial [Chthoniobacterales bacterium]
KAHRLLLFGGYGDNGEMNDTWSWNGTTWTELHPATSPSPRTYPSMCADPAGNAVVLFGGFNFFAGGALNDTWT